MRGLLISILVFAIQSLALAQEHPPIANAGPDLNAYTGVPVFLNGTASDPDGNPIIEWGWTVEIAPSSSWDLVGWDTPSPLFAAFVPGDYVLSFRVADAYFQSAPDFVTIHVADNLPPVAVATADKTTITVGDTVCFDGSQSYDPEEGPLTYDWYFGDGYSASEVSPCHTFSSSGTFDVTLIVIDERSASDSNFVTIIVSDQPIAVASATPISGPAPLAVQFDGSQSHGDTGRTLSFLWDFGDGNTSTDISPTHTFGPGLYTVNFTVTDDIGGIGTTNLQLVAGHNGNWPPVADAGTNRWVDTNVTTFLNGSATDHDSQPILSWSWTVVSAPAGAQYMLIDPADPHSAFSAQTPGTYILSLVASDGIDASLPDTVVVWVGIEMPPVADAGPDRYAYAGVAIALAGSAVDPDGDLIIEWGWAVETAPAPNSWDLAGWDTSSPIFIGFVPGDYLLSFRVADAYSQSAPDTVLIRVVDVNCRIGDLTGDCWVDIEDLDMFCEQWLKPADCFGQAGCPDLIHDDYVDFDDFAELARDWGI